VNCADCGEINPAHARFCLGCGCPFGATRALTGPAGDRRRVSVLFADIAGSTALVAGADPEDAASLLAAVVETMMRAVVRFKGDVLRNAGDGIMALFGASVAQEDHARSACLAALSMQAELALRDALPRVGAAGPIRVRIGIDSGDVLIRPIISGLHTGYSVEGQTTHLAAKAEQAARPGTVVVTAEVARLVEGFIETRARDPVHVPGLPEPVRLLELVRATDAHNRFQVATRRGLGPFVGREHEMAQLEHAAEQVERGVAQVKVVVGDAGVGKSRLLWECKRRLQARGWAVLSAHSTARGARSAYYPIVAVLKELYRIEPGDSAEVVGMKLTRRPPGEAYTADLPPLLALFDQPAGEPGWNALDAARRLERTHAALISAVLNGAQQRATAVLIDDLHEVDNETSEFIRRLSERLDGSKLLLLLEYRPGHGFEFEPRASTQLLRVEPLPEQTTVALFRQLAGSDTSLARLEREVVQRVAGNPLFIEESVRMLSETGFLDGPAGGYRAGRPSGAMPIPASVKNVLESRIARLAPAQRQTLQVAAVFGNRIHMPVLAALLGGAIDAVTGVIARLVDLELLIVSSELRADECAFKHAFTRETAYESMAKAQRKETHARVIALLESPLGSALPERIELLAQHAMKAGDWDRAVDYLQQAARRAEERSAVREAVHNLDAALSAVPNLSAARRLVECEIDLRLALRGPLVALGHMRRVADEVRQLEALEPECVDPARQARLAVFVCGHRWITGEPMRAVKAGRRAIAIASAHDDLALLIPARQYVGGALHAMGEHAEAQALLTANVIGVPETAPGSRFGMAGLPAVFCRATRGWSHEHVGNFAAAETDALDAMRIGRASGHGFSILSGSFSAGSLHIARGEFAEAARLLTQALALCNAERQRMWLPLIGPMLAVALARGGDPAAALALIDRTVPQPDSAPLTTFAVLTVAEVYAMVDRVDSAARMAEASLKRARKHGERIWEAHALHLLGETAAGRSAPDLSAAEANQLAARGLAKELGMRPLAARCRLELASIHERRGELAQAHQQLSGARAEFAALGVPYWVSRTRELEGAWPDRVTG